MPEVLKHTADCETVINICSRAADTLFNHPRLKVELLMIQRKATIERGGDEAEDMEIGIDDLSLEILWLQKNILAADDGRFDDIQQKSHLKHDPVE